MSGIVSELPTHALPICLLISSAWAAVGESLYRNAFNTMQIYTLLQKNKLIFKLCKRKGVSLTSHPPFGMNEFYAPDIKI